MAQTQNSTLNTQNSILEVRGLKKYFPIYSGLFAQRVEGWVRAVDDVSFSIRRGETLGLVGESGCGKTTTGRCILQLDRPTAGEVLFEGQNLARMADAALRPLRRQMQIVFQDPYSSLNPRMTVGQILSEPIRVHRISPDGRRYEDRVAELLSVVGLNPLMAGRYPHELSGGQRQRVGIARALALGCRVLVLDEPTSALDSESEKYIQHAIEDLRSKHEITLVVIAHRLSTIRSADRILVIDKGRVVESGAHNELIHSDEWYGDMCRMQAEPVEV